MTAWKPILCTLAAQDLGLILLVKGNVTEGASRSNRDTGTINKEQAGQQEAVTAASLVEEADKSAL